MSLITVFDIAQRFTGMQEISGAVNNQHIMEMLKLDNSWPQDDETPWCSAFANYIVWLWNKISPMADPLPRSKDLRARSWLAIGTPIDLDDAVSGNDIIILQRGSGKQPGPNVIDAPGHVGFYAGYDRVNDLIEILGGNQGDTVKISKYHANRLLGVRRIV